MKKAQIEFEKAQIAEKLSYHIITEEAAASYTAVANQKETASLISALTVNLAQLSVFHQKRLALGFGTAKELETYENEYATHAMKVVSELEAARVKGYTHEVQDRAKIHQATLKDQKQELDDAVKLAEAKVTVAQTELAGYSALASANLGVLRAQRALAIQEVVRWWPKPRHTDVRRRRNHPSKTCTSSG